MVRMTFVMLRSQSSEAIELRVDEPASNMKQYSYFLRVCVAGNKPVPSTAQAIQAAEACIAQSMQHLSQKVRQ
jgi:hypothetical protein